VAPTVACGLAVGEAPAVGSGVAVPDCLAQAVRTTVPATSTNRNRTITGLRPHIQREGLNPYIPSDAQVGGKDTEVDQRLKHFLR